MDIPSHFLLSSFQIRMSAFKGSCANLLLLVQSKEIDILEVVLLEIAHQLKEYLEKNQNLDVAAEACQCIAHLLFLKSGQLLPKPLSEEPHLDGEEIRLQTLKFLAEYTRFKEIAGQLTAREEGQRRFFTRFPQQEQQKEIGHGLDEVTFDDLKLLFSKIIARSAQKPKVTLVDEEWDVATLVTWFEKRLYIQKKILFEEIFSVEKTRGELIALLLALLEMIKQTKVRVVREEEIIYIIQLHEKDS